MACLLKAPDGPAKGCIVFTTAERDSVIKTTTGMRDQVAFLKKRYVIGLHHNWHDHQFRYDPLFDFSMAGDGDLIEADGKDFARLPLDACNFTPPCYSAPRGNAFWDILYVARAVDFKGIPEFLRAIRILYDGGSQRRVLFICPVPEKIDIPGIRDLRADFEAMFTHEERQRVTLLTIEWDYPFPFDAETLAFFYRSSRIFFHPAPDERRCRTAAYAWAAGMPVVGTPSVASILPDAFRRPPFLFLAETPAAMAQALKSALEMSYADKDRWADIQAQFSASSAAQSMATELDRLANAHSWGTISAQPINPTGLDIRLGRHHGISTGPNKVELPLAQLCKALLVMNDAQLQAVSRTADPENALREIWSYQSPPPVRRKNLLQKLGILS